MIHDLLLDAVQVRGEMDLIDEFGALWLGGNREWHSGSAGYSGASSG